VTCKSTAAAKTVRLSAAALGILLWASAHDTQAADGDCANVLSAGAPLYGRLPEALGGAFPPVPRNKSGSPGVSSLLGSPLPDLRPSFRYAFGSDPLLASDRARETQREVFLRNSDPLLRAKLRVTQDREWLFVYADMGAVDSPLRWQGMVGIRVGKDVRLLGGWRRITYYFSPGREFDSLDFDGPFIGAQRTW